MKNITIQLPFLRTAILAGVSLGLLTTTLFWGGGEDAYLVFFKDVFKTTPPYVNLFLKPLTLLEWPYSYTILCALAIITVILAIKNFNSNMFLVLLSMPLIWELWCGQVDWMPVAGILIGYAIINERLSINWYGFGILLLFSKIWVGFGPAIYLTYIILKANRISKLIIPILTLFVVFVALYLFYGPLWITEYIQNFKGEGIFLLNWTDANGATPYGLGILSWIFVPFGPKDRLSILKRITAASFLSMPYLRFYHLLAILVLISDNVTGIIVFLTGWIGFILPDGRQLAWLIPAEVLLIDFARYKLPLVRKYMLLYAKRYCKYSATG